MLLALLFDEQLAVAKLPALDLISFRASGVGYHDVGAGYLTAHYDRLVDAQGEFAGIQLWANPEEAGLGRLLDQLRPRRYLEALGGRLPGYRVHWSGTVDPSLTDTGNQAFGGQLFLGNGGEVAMTIDLDYLCGGATEAGDLRALGSAPLRWLELSALVERAL